MYSLDINFLNDRTERQSEAGLKRGAVKQVQDDPRPYYLGAAVAIAIPALVAGFWLFLQNQNRGLEQRQAELTSQLTALQAQLDEVKNVSAQVSAIEADNQALATVFDRIKPWSAILQDVRARVPSGVQIGLIQQFEQPAPPAPTTPPPAGQAAPPPPETPPPGVRITGQARSFNDVNDFVLTLQRSPFLDGESVQLVSSKLIDNPTQVEFSEQGGERGELEVKLPKVVEYTIEGGLTNLPASELLQDLERTLSVGLASRIQALRDRGVLQK